MSAPAFTPGPWLVHSTARLIVPAADAFKMVTRKGNREVDFEADEAPNSIALLRDCDEQMSEDESLSNGFLIAAAPDLYQALEAICASFPADAPALIEANAALAKARGEA